VWIVGTDGRWFLQSQERILESIRGAEAVLIGKYDITSALSSSLRARNFVAQWK